MSILVNRRCLRSAGSNLFLPPFNSPQPAIKFELDLATEVVPFAGIAIVKNQLVGRSIDIQFALAASSVGGALALQDNIESALRNSSGVARSVDYCEWLDDTATYKRIYRGCQVIDGPNWGAAVSEKHRECSFTLLCPTPTKYTTFSDGSTPGTSPYEIYLLDGAYVGDGGAGGGGGGGSYTPPDPGEVPVPIANTETISGIFPGAPIAGQQHDRQIYCGASNFNVIGVKVIASSPGASATVIRVSNTSGGGGSYLQITIAADGSVAARVSGSVEFADGDHVYVVIMTAGGHADIQYEFTAESA